MTGPVCAPTASIYRLGSMREITHMHMIDPAIATERDETLWLN